ncbi:LTA synthase family protein [Enterococcus sp.]|uniref:LTA synthase family protein n=1 Tax=Enterococcus sp. TaxID=35783 RepID=UPI0028A7827B|nr:LTA synthase family protein [Enterococcus sp.]
MKQKLPQYGKIALKVMAVIGLIIFSNLFLQWCQNNLSISLALKFAFSWHTEKFFLACLVLALVYGFFASIAGSLRIGGVFYSVGIGILGYANYMKMSYRQEPIYPDDLKMVTQFTLLRTMIGNGAFLLAMLLAIAAIVAVGWSIYRSRKLKRRQQIFRGIVLILCSLGLVYVSHFNDSTNLLRKAYNRTALWIPYSQKMNYYNTGFIGGFLYNLRVDAMEKPAGYSKEAVEEIAAKYSALADDTNKTRDSEAPNIVYVMSESFSDPSHLKGITITGDPLEDYYQVADQTIRGKMLSQNYGGGTANIEFEALTSFSMGLMNPQMTTPYTMLVPKLTQLPSLVSFLKQDGYGATAIHPYDTSMYKRKDVYDVMGFDSFLDQDTMTYTDKIENNPYISDASAYKEVMSVLSDEAQPQFVHLVTMQTHMPYVGKYDTLDYQATGDGNMDSLENYLQDVSYSSTALKEFISELSTLNRRTLVVFWGDHLPGIYSDAIKDQNDTATLHETQFLMVDSDGDFQQQDVAVTSPFYFAPTLLEESQQPTNGFYEMLLTLQEELPAFETGQYYIGGQWQTQLSLNKETQAVYDAYQMIQYDVLQGEQYSLATDLFGE